jgi:hypothetical protein
VAAVLSLVAAAVVAAVLTQAAAVRITKAEDSK